MEVALILTAGKALMEIQAGKDRKDAYYSQAQHKELEGRREAVKAKEDGIEVLRQMRRALANIGATAFAGGLEPNITGGTIENIGTQNVLNPGFSDFFTAQSNSRLALSMSRTQAEELRFAGRQAKQQGVMNAIGTIAGGMATASKIGGPTDTTSTATNSSYMNPRYSDHYNRPNYNKLGNNPRYQGLG